MTEASTKTLLNKTALVTGGSRGIGAGIAKKLAAEGAAVAITYSASPDKAAAVVDEIIKNGGKAIAIKADAAHEAEVREAVAKTVAGFGKIDILVNNAGVAGGGTIEETTVVEFDRIYNINVKGLFIASQEAAKHMTSGGRIINIGSIVGDIALFPGLTAYVMSKSAVAGLTRAMARELAPRGITVNNVQPGPIDTDMNPADGPMDAVMQGMVPQGRYGRTDELANVVAFLATDGASYVNGAQIRVDGAITA